MDPMTLKAQITEDMKAAMRARDAERLGTIRMLLAAIKQQEVDQRTEPDDTAILAIVGKLIKQRRDSVTAYTEGGRQDLADKESAEIQVLQAYLPAQLSADAVATTVAEIIAQTGATGPRDMGKVMGAAKQRLAGQADMGLVSQLVKQALADG